MIRKLIVILLFFLPLVGFSQSPEQIVKQYVSLLDNFLMSPNSSSKRMAFENSKLIEGCLFNDEIYVKYKKDSHIVDCKTKDYAGILSDAINASRGHTYANVKIVRDLAKSNSGGKYEVTAYLQYTGAIEMRIVTIFHIKNGKIFALTNDFIKTKEWISGDNHHDPPVVIVQNPPIINNDNNSGNSRLTFTISGVSFDMIKVSGGTFQMGSNDSEANDYEKPVHSVTLSDYYIGETEVTQGLWKAVMGSNPSYFKKGDSYPVEYVSWNDCQEFIKKLNQKTGKNFRLPTEAEWEYAARGGNKSKGYKYSGSNNLSEVAWYGYGNYSDKNRTITERRTKPVKTKIPNELGLYDMSGNVREWCNDWYKSDYYANSPSNNPQGASSGSFRVLRGGSWGNGAKCCRSSDRFCDNPDRRIHLHGLRLVLVP